MNLLKALLLLATLTFGVACQPIVASPVSSTSMPIDSDEVSKEAGPDGTFSGNEGAYQELLIHANMILGLQGISTDLPITPHIILGALPSNLPFVLQFPSESRIIGSIATPDENEGSIYATTPLPLPDVWEFLRAEFEQLGYTSVSNLVPLHFVSTHYLLCGPDPNIEVSVVLYETDSGNTDIQIHISKSLSGGPCLANSLAPTSQP